MTTIKKYLPWAGAALLSIWTVLRHITNGINMDVTGQIGLVAQWSSGLRGGAELGPTNYVIKMPLYWLMNHATFFSPRLRLLLLALICNLAAFALIYWLGSKLLKQQKIKNDTLWRIAIMWLGLLGGRVFWADYANSRNLEIAGGLAVVYLVLITVQNLSWPKLMGLAALASLVFFADPLEMYLLLPPLVVYGLTMAWQQKTKTPLLVGVGLLAGLLGAKLLKQLTVWLLPIHFAQLPRIQMVPNWATLKQIVGGVSNSTLRLFDMNFAGRALGPNTVRQLISAFIVGGIIIFLAQHWRGIKSPIKWLLLGIIIWNYAVYVASGNAIFAMTERYIVWVAISLLLLIGLAGDALKKQRRMQISWLALMAVSGILLVGALVISWPQRFSKDVPTFDTAQLAQSKQYDYAIASWQLAVPANYFAGYNVTPILPVVCKDGQHITLRDMFYDADAWAKLGQSNSKVALLLPDAGIDSGPIHCSKENILTQLSNPVPVGRLPSVGSIYELRGNSTALQTLRTP